ncbi:MAG: DUF1987 domain-containing protein [Cyclobacteriaceae bacterium]|nr:SiaC family regulatory phosphoprotein [Cyclobacteriaceae bacterium]MCH8516674.1 DUF1987 domain-containing protein [Cyclobacteriaceae bacterium]
MEFKVAAKEGSPHIDLSLDGYLLIEGQSYEDGVIDNFSDLNKAIEEYFQNKSKLAVRLSLNYFNTATSKCIYDLLESLNERKKKGADVTFQWFYPADDEELKEEIEEMVDLAEIDCEILQE